MGYDPFWPTSLATVNVLIVPACQILEKRFNEIFDSLKKVSHVDLCDVDLEGANGDLIFSAKPQSGSILFNYSKTSRHSGVQRFPLEVNADPQIILGIYEAAAYEAGPNEDRDGHSDVPNVLSKFLSNFEPPQNGSARLLLSLVSIDTEFPPSVIQLNGTDREAVYTSLTKASGHLVRNVIALTSKLTDVQLLDPRLLSQLADRSVPGGSHDASRTTLQERTNGEQPSPDLSQIAVQTTDRQKGRYTIAVGLLNLLIGSWTDAMRRLSEGAASANESGDRLWHARAVEGLLICMTLQAWQGGDFTVPEVFDPSKAYLASQSSQRSRSASISARITAIAQRSDVSQLKPFERWFQLAPFVANLTIELYSTSQHRDIPQLIFTEARIRLINMLIFCQVSKGSQEHFDRFILDGQFPPLELHPSIARAPDASLASMLVELTSSLEMSINDLNIVEALSAAIKSLAALGSNRKHALLFRNLLSRLAPAMIKARKLGASEAGIHPAAALSATSSNTEVHESGADNGLQNFLMAAATASGIKVPIIERSGPVDTSTRLASDLERWTNQQLAGDLALKLEVLRSCIDVCDAMPDMQASLTFTAELLRLAIRNPTISVGTTSSRPWFTPEIQTHYTDNIKRTTAAARRMGLDNASALYWDNFLVRDVQLYQAPNASQLTSHQPSELSVTSETSAAGPRDPFIFNPFAKTASTNATPIVVAGELITFSVLLQNPLEVEVDINDISLATEGCDFRATHHSMVIGMFCVQMFTLTGTACERGSLTVLGCRAIVDGCHEQVFPIYRDGWQAPIQIKQKPKTPRRQPSEDVDTVADLGIPQVGTFSLSVIDPQPQIELESVDLSQGSLMLLEGEKKSFELSIKNTSHTVPADLVLSTYQDNVSSSLQATLGRKDLASADTYEVQHQLKYRPTIETSSRDDILQVPPEEAIKRYYDIFGRPGLLKLAIQVNFAHLGKPRSEVKETFHTRHTVFPISVTVNGSVEILRFNILPVADDFTSISTDRMNSAKAGTSPDGYCMLSFDMRNVWPQPLSVHMTYRSEEAGSPDTYTFDDTILPGQTSRAILLVPRIFVQDVYAPIPSLMAQRQFVVSASKLSLEAEAASRETFWYREALLKLLHGTWTEAKTERHGEIDLRKGVRLTPRMIDVLKVEHVDISFEVKPDAKAAADKVAYVEKLARSYYTVPVESFTTLHVRVHNRSRDKLALLLRLQPSLRDQPHNIALDLSRRLAWSGVLQQALYPPLEPGDTREAKLGIVPFAAGSYVVNATVEEIKGRRRVTAPSADGVIGSGPERRIWHARTPCLIDAVDT